MNDNKILALSYHCNQETSTQYVGLCLFKNNRGQYGNGPPTDKPAFFAKGKKKRALELCVLTLFLCIGWPNLLATTVCA